jgi:hypothetical protein
LTEAGIARAWADALERGCETVVAPHVANGCWPAPFCGCRAATCTKEMAVKRLVNAHMQSMLRRRSRRARRSATRRAARGIV